MAIDEKCVEAGEALFLFIDQTRFCCFVIKFFPHHIFLLTDEEAFESGR